MAPPVTWEKDTAHAIQAPEQQGVGRRAPRGFDLLPGLILQPVDIVQAGAADDPDDWFGQWTLLQSLRLAT